jgi:excisionase family DNA binding protein
MTRELAHQLGETLALLLEQFKAEVLGEVHRAVRQAQNAVPMPHERVYTEQELCAATGLSRSQVWKLRKAGRLAFRRVGRRVVYRQADVDAFLEASKGEPPDGE